MKKHFRFIILALLVLVLGSAAAARAEIIPPYGEGQIGLQAVVLCENLTVREEPRAGAREVTTLPYGRRFAVQKQENGWADCFASDAVDAGQTGTLIKQEGAWYKVKVGDITGYVYNWFVKIGTIVVED